LDTLLRAREQGELNPIELLVLSACQTATGDRRAALGLAGLAVRSGARSTLATLWSVNDRSTALFMVEFYRELGQPGVTKAQAVRNAQLALLKQPQYEHPYYWAPFILLGNWL
jgi:CHAT domain-containing protein